MPAMQSKLQSDAETYENFKRAQAVYSKILTPFFPIVMLRVSASIFSALLREESVWDLKKY